MSKVQNFNDLLDKEDVDEIFTLEEEIASGSFGTVYKGTYLPTKQTMAIKIITPEEDEIPEDLMIEIALLKQCRSKNIVRYFGGYRKGDEIFIAMELCSCSVRDIFDYTEDPLLEKEIALIARQSLEGLEYMHANNFIHRDIKGGNILITDEGEVKLVDFGVSSLDARKAKTFVGTPYWMAPELIESKNGLTGYGPEIDIWSIGITCIELAETMPPLSYINPMRALFQIPARDAPTLEKKAKWSAEFHDFLAKCLEKNPKKRPNATELLKHPFVRDCDTNPQVLKDLIKRKKVFEEGGDDFEEEEEEIEFEEDEDLSSDSYSTLDKNQTAQLQSPNNKFSATSSPKVEDDDDLEAWLQGADKKATIMNVPMISAMQISQSSPNFNFPPPNSPAPIAPSHQSFEPKTPSNINNNNNNNSHNQSSQLIGQHNNNNNHQSPQRAQSESAIVSPAASISDLRNSIAQKKADNNKGTKGRANMQRPPPTTRSNKATQRANYYNQKAKPLNKRLIKDQMAALRNLQLKEQKKVEKQEKDQLKEREQLQLNYKKQMETVSKSYEQNKLKMEKQNKIDMDSLQKNLKDQRKNLTKQFQTEQRNRQNDIKEMTRLAAKNHADAQKKRTKEQKEILKQSKKIRTKSELKMIEKEHKVELLLNDQLFNLGQFRVKLIQEHELQWIQNSMLQKATVTDLQQTHQAEKDYVKQMYQSEIDSHTLLFKYKEEELAKLQPLNMKQVQERHQLQQQNLQSQLDIERQQQTDLLLVDQKNQKKEYLEQKKQLEKQNLVEQKQIAKLKGRSKAEVKVLQNECRSKFITSLQANDKEFEDLLAQQRKDEEEQMQVHHNRQKEEQFQKHLAELEELEKTHSKQQLELRLEEITERTRIVTDYFGKLKELIQRQQQDQTTGLQSVHENRLVCLQGLHKEANELFENHKKEVLAFVQQNCEKLLPASQKNFSEVVEEHFKEAMEALHSDQRSQQQSLSEELERQNRDLQQTQFQETQEVDRSSEKEKEDLASEFSQLQMQTAN